MEGVLFQAAGKGPRLSVFLLASGRKPNGVPEEYFCHCFGTESNVANASDLPGWVWNHVKETGDSSSSWMFHQLCPARSGQTANTSAAAVLPLSLCTVVLQSLPPLPVVYVTFTVDGVYYCGDRVCYQLLISRIRALSRLKGPELQASAAVLVSSDTVQLHTYACRKQGPKLPLAPRVQTWKCS